MCQDVASASVEAQDHVDGKCFEALWSVNARNRNRVKCGDVCEKIVTSLGLVQSFRICVVSSQFCEHKFSSVLHFQTLFCHICKTLHDIPSSART